MYGKFQGTCNQGDTECEIKNLIDLACRTDLMPWLPNFVWDEDLNGRNTKRHEDVAAPKAQCELIVREIYHKKDQFLNKCSRSNHYCRNEWETVVGAYRNKENEGDGVIYSKKHRWSAFDPNKIDEWINFENFDNNNHPTKKLNGEGPYWTGDLLNYICATASCCDREIFRNGPLFDMVDYQTKDIK